MGLHRHRNKTGIYLSFDFVPWTFWHPLLIAEGNFFDACSRLDYLYLFLFGLQADFDEYKKK